MITNNSNASTISLLGSIDWSILDAYHRGVNDGLHVGVYDNALHDTLRDENPLAGSAYKAGYDRGITDYCETEGLDD